MKPYYEQDGITIYHGDCREILPTLERFDLLLTDPPYGIDADNRKRILSRGKLAAAKDYGESNWDSKPADAETLKAAVDICQLSVIWGGNYFSVPPSSCWLIWDKQNGANDFADAELAWTNLDKAVRLKQHLWNGMLRKNNEARFHPTQKPLDLMLWCINQAPGIRTLLDPWMGSGTSLLAAKVIGIQATGIDINEAYCEIAANRLAQGVLLTA